MTFLTKFLLINLAKIIFRNFSGKNNLAFGENGQNWVILGAKIRHRSKFWGWDEIIFFLKHSQELC